MNNGRLRALDGKSAALRLLQRRDHADAIRPDRGLQPNRFQIGRFVQNRADTEIKARTGAIQASILGLLALLLGFCFSMSMQRDDNRSQALIEEANAIGTAK